MSLGLYPARASADTPPQATSEASATAAPHQGEAETKAAAERQFRAGVSFQKVEDFESAIVAFQSSIRLYPTMGAWFNLANCLRATHRYPEALDALEQLKQDFSATLQDPMRSTVELQISDLKNLTGSLRLEVEPAGASVSIDGKPVGTAPFDAPIRVNLGDHEIEVTANGYGPSRERINLGPDQRITHKVLLIQATPTSPPVPAPTPAPTPPPSPPASPVDTATGSGVQTAGVITAGAGTLLLIGGTVTGLMALSLDSDLDRDCVDGHCPNDRASDVHRLDRLATATNSLLAIGALACATGVGLWFFGAPTEHEQPVPHARLDLKVGASFMTAQVAGTF